jgi:hypothetical protein
VALPKIMILKVITQLIFVSWVQLTLTSNKNR